MRQLPADWTERKCANLAARPRLLIKRADLSPSIRHDGGLYLGAGAIALEPGRGGKLFFGWPLDPALRAPLRRYAERARA